MYIWQIINKFPQNIKKKLLSFNQSTTSSNLLYSPVFIKSLLKLFRSGLLCEWRLGTAGIQDRLEHLFRTRTSHLREPALSLRVHHGRSVSAEPVVVRAACRVRLRCDTAWWQAARFHQPGALVVHTRSQVGILLVTHRLTLLESSRVEDPCALQLRCFQTISADLLGRLGLLRLITAPANVPALP